MMKKLIKSKRSTRVQTQAEYGLFSSKRSNSRADFENNKRILLKSTRSQHEAMGFVIIVALVIIVGVIFLGIQMNKDSTPQQYKDSNIMNFLIASSKYTSDCFENHEPLTLNDLKEKCYNNQKCSREGVEVDSCIYLNETYSDMLSKSWLIYEGSPIKYYELKINYRGTCNDSLTINPSSELEIQAGNSSQCSFSSKKIGQESFPISGSGEGCIVSELMICEKETK